MIQRVFIFFFIICLYTAPAQTGLTAHAGISASICPGSSYTLGSNPTASNGIPPYVYMWAPAALVNNPDSANPITTPSVTTVYTLTVRDKSGKEASSTVTVSLYPYSVYAGKDTTISQGQTITLHGIAPNDSSVWWMYKITGNQMFNPNILNPNYFAQQYGVDTLTLAANFPHGCTLYDQLVLTIIPSTTLYFFNSFSPNHDNVNDLFIIGNIQDFPNNTLDIYNRYGQNVFSKTSYQNDWDGSYMGNELPAGTYFYILDTHDAKGGKYHGEVTIIK